MNVKGIDAARRPALVEDYERGDSDVIQPAPWQTDTCIGEWHYRRSLFDEHRYKTVAQVVHMLVNVVSKNGNLLLSIPVRGDGTIDEDEVAFLEGLAAWMRVHGEGIFGTRPWKVAGEGPAKSAAGMFNEGRATYGARDVRFTTKGDTLFAFLLGWPADRRALIASLASTSPLLEGRKVADVSLLGDTGRVEWTQGRRGAGRAASGHAGERARCRVEDQGRPVKTRRTRRSLRGTAAPARDTSPDEGSGALTVGSRSAVQAPEQTAHPIAGCAGGPDRPDALSPIRRSAVLE